MGQVIGAIQVNNFKGYNNQVLRVKRNKYQRLMVIIIIGYRCKKLCLGVIGQEQQVLEVNGDNYY